jgi:hypothetical protein
LQSWFLTKLHDVERSDAYTAITSELGVTPPAGPWGTAWGSFFEHAELRDILDTITLTFRVLARRGGAARTREFHAFVTRVFHEESLGYVMDDNGGVRFSIDAEYERNRFSVIDGLAGVRYGAVRAAAENAFKRMDGKPDTKAAVREMFEAAETLCKLIASTNEDLDERMVQKRLKPIASRAYASVDPSAQSFAEQVLEGFVKWVNAGHKYRHGPKTEEPRAPTLELAVFYLSNGAAFIRFLIDLDARILV